ncbi:MAG: hypothetical protein FIB00_10410 [Chloroflexi bacterium]|nr:hypothetical protein [Chloroflexota bacterium]PWB42690.1 MAG: hypothetical protein C3F10_13190 [Dehalococcoidia bacterium]
MPVPQIVTPSECHANRLALAITRLTGQLPVVFRCGDSWFIATDAIDQGELNELFLVVENLPGLTVRPLLREAPMGW